MEHRSLSSRTLQIRVKRLGKIGPGLRSKAVLLRNQIQISYRKIPNALEELFGITFSPSAPIGFEKALAGQAERELRPLVVLRKLTFGGRSRGSGGGWHA